MQIYEIKLKLYLLEDIRYEESLEKIASFLDLGLCKNELFLQQHKASSYKNYVFNYLYPIEEDKVYKRDKIYTLVIRTISSDIAKFIESDISNHYNKFLKALTSEVRILPKKHIEKIYSITPIIIKNDSGYWRDKESLAFFEERFKANIAKKLKVLGQARDLTSHSFYKECNFKNRKPVATKFKNIKLLGDKVELTVKSDEVSQELAYMILGIGVGENNSRGFGFMNFRWL